MKCNHDVTSYQWEKCSRCGKYVRVNFRREIIRRITIVVLCWIVAPSFADWGIYVLHLSEHNPYNITHALIGGIPVLLICYSICKILPIFDEKGEG